jgi:hypothetical protein
LVKSLAIHSVNCSCIFAFLASNEPFAVLLNTGKPIAANFSKSSLAMLNNASAAAIFANAR